MKNTHEQSMEVYDRLIQDPISGPFVPYKPQRPEIYGTGKKHTVAIIRTDDQGRVSMKDFA